MNNALGNPEKGQKIDWKGIENRINKCDLPPMDISFWAHLDSFALNLVMRGSQTIRLEGLAPMGMPK